MMVCTAQDRRSHGRPVGGAGRVDALRRGHRRGAHRPRLRRLAAVRRSRRRPGAAPGAHRRRVPGAARPLRRGRLHPGAARAARHPVHRLGRARLGAGDEQGQGQGAVPAEQPPHRPGLRGRGRRRRGPAGGARLLRLPGGGQAGGRGLVARASGSRATSSSSRPRSRTRCASTTTCWSSASSTARRSRSASSTASRSAPSRSRPSAASTTSRTSTRAAAPTTTCRRACRPSAIARCCGSRRWRTRRSAATARRASI